MIYYSKTSLLLIFIVAVTVCNFKLSNCQSNACDDCPADCEYGLKQIKDSEGRCKCVCAENPCLNRTCPERTKCKLRAVRNCQQGNCQLTMKPACVLSIKAGFCPAPDIIDESTSAQCQDDSDCDGTFKCCPSLTRNSCSRSCAVTKCKCAADMVSRETYNKQGCPVCICSKEASNETRNDVCSLARQYGDCQSDRQHYYFDSQERRCKSFTYSGCGGNGNNFLTLEFCQRKCLPELFGHSNRKEMAKCFKPSAIGQCKGAFKRFYYNYTAQKCESFIYGGCEGNDNNFIEQEECDKICTVPIMALAKNPVLKCTQPLEIGNCRGAISRHFYNQTSQRCEEFTYSGCKGNGNNFESIDDCSKVCNEDSLIRINLIRGRRPQHGHHNHPLRPFYHRMAQKCTLKMDIGPCKGSISRYFYNTTSKKCEEFKYGGCEGNDNNFESSDQCKKDCGGESGPTPIKQDKCQIEPFTGPCRGFFRRWFFNKTSQSCEEFVYGGCQKNENNFETKASCMKDCGSVIRDSNEKCSAAPEPGLCKGYFPKFFFNATSQKCEQFIYGGCGGNENKYETSDECKKSCGGNQTREASSTDKCAANPETGLCRGYFPKYFFNVTSQQCEQFIYGGCGGNENNYESVDDCRKSCGGLLVFERDVKPKCQLDMDKGDCRGNIKRFYFNRSTKKCEEFSYGGCGGNENNFESNDLCLKECGSEPPSDLKSEKCSAAPEQGLCRGYFPKFFFNATSQRCEQFIYGGCGGNENKYETSDECKKSCGGNQTREVSTTDKCAANPEPGLCRGYFPKYFFNVTSQRCEQFIYGGCGGNENNYESADDCRKSCGGSTQTRNVPEKCTPQPDSGNCLAYIESFFYNITSQKCEQFIYGGCGGNENKFESSEQCTKECISTQTVQREANDDTICSLPSSTGSCKGNFEQFYFNEKSNKCEKFIYSGCGGNDNRFETEAQCNQKCSPKTQSNTLQPKCNQPVAPGNCRAYIESYFYNSTSKKCEFFVYGGCNGNENNFVSVDECKKECGGGDSESEIVTVERESTIDNKCDLAPFTGPCRGSFRRWFFNKTAQTCQEFIYGGCQKNENNFETKDECIKGCGSSEVNVIRESNEKCSAAPEQGLCRGYFPKFFFNATSQRCEQFIYGGCGGNENNYESVDDCRKSCGGNQTREVSTTDKCAANPEPGLCRGYFPKYFFNVTSQRCEQFIYGGCGGNENNYESADDCRKSCGGSTQTRNVPEKCTPQPDSGNCFAYIERFFYNITSQKCEQFIYGGCGGNENNFETSDDCAKSCGGDLTLREATENDKCTAIADPGLCFGYFPKYFFNVTSQKCEKFIYGGCGGNENNYETVEQCKKSCSPLKTDRNVNIKCSLERHQGYCRDEILRYYYDAEAKKCQHFIYTGCGGNENNFETITDCENECDDTDLNIDDLTEKESSDLGKCSTKVDSGLCRGYFPRFWFNPEKRECEEFVYGGCGGNENNYESIDDCRKSCGVEEIRAAENCTLKPDSGTCEALMKRFFFNVTSQKCEEFVYGGCGGNGNNYRTADECKSSCVSAATPKKCAPQPDPGNCFANIPRFFYNITSKKCEEFIYGGCGGNENNFESSEQCLKECSVQLQSSPIKKFTDKSLCLLSPETGTCSGVIQKYYFNSQSKRCETFVYSGCGGNVNNFDNSEECVETCAKSWKPRRIEHLHTGD